MHRSVTFFYVSLTDVRSVGWYTESRCCNIHAARTARLNHHRGAYGAPARAQGRTRRAYNIAGAARATTQGGHETCGVPAGVLLDRCFGAQI
jgi:hypothetical protein